MDDRTRDAWRLLVPLLLAAFVAAATTSRTLREPPSLPLLLLGGAAVVAAMLLGRGRGAVALAGALAAGAAAGHVLAAPGVPRVHDLMHFWGIWAYGRCVTEGSLFPLWIPYLGLGQPLLQFYGPLNFLLALPGIALGLSPVGAWKLELFTAHLLCPAATLAAARLLGASWRGALLAATALAFAPWRLSVFDYRGALGEANAFVFMPIAAAAALRSLSRPSPRVAALLVVGLSGLLLTHVVSLLSLLLVLLPCLIVQALVGAPRPGPRGWRWLAAGCLIAAGLTAVWWIPVAAHGDRTSVERTTRDNPYYRYEQQGVAATELVERQRWDRLRVALPRSIREQPGQAGEQMPFYCGATLLALALSSPWWSRRRECWPLVAGCAAALLLSTDGLARIGEWLPPLAHVRFPWRFLSPATVLAALALGCAYRTTGDSEPRRAGIATLAPLLLVGALMWDAAPYTGAADRIPPYHGVVHWYTEDPRWVWWEESMRPVPVILGDGEVVQRVRNLELPPERYDSRVDAFFPAYYEWFTPEVYERYWRARDPESMAEAGVRWGFSNMRPQPVQWRARPYATLETGGAAAAIPPRQVERKPGRILVNATAPAGGATLIVREQAFPGWRARVDGGAWMPPRTVRGFIALELSAGRRRVELDHAFATPARLSGLAVSLLTALALATLLHPELRRRLRNGVGASISSRPA